MKCPTCKQELPNSHAQIMLASGKHDKSVELVKTEGKTAGDLGARFAEFCCENVACGFMDTFLTRYQELKEECG